MDQKWLLDRWIPWAREHLLEGAELPLLDLIARLIQLSVTEPEELAKLDWRVFDPEELLGQNPWSYLWWEGWEDEDLDVDLPRAYLAAAPNDLATRTVVLGYVYGVYDLARRRAANSEGEDDFDEEEHGQLFLVDFRELVLLQDPARLTDPRLVKWEIVTACAAQAWDRVSQLYYRLFTLEEVGEAKRRALRGQLGFQIAIAERDEAIAGGGLGWWKPELDTPAERVAWALTPVEPEPYSSEHLSRLSDAVNDLTVGFREDPSLPHTLRFLLAKGLSILDEHPKAAREYEALLRLAPFAEEWWSPSHLERLYARTAECHELAGNKEKAIELYQALLNEFPTSRGFWREIARMQAANADYYAAYASLSKEVELDPGLEDRDLGVRIALALGGVADVRGLEREWKQHPEYSQALHAIISAHWPQFSTLSPSSQEDWLFGGWLLWDPLVQPQRHSSLFKAAVLKFGMVVEGELKARVIEPFKANVSRDQKLRARAEQGQKKGPARDLCRFLLDKGPITLGQLLSPLFRHEPSEIEKELQEWAQGRHPELARNFAYWSDGWRRINKLRQRGAHPQEPVSAEDAQDMYRLCLRFLTTLVAQPNENS